MPRTNPPTVQQQQCRFTCLCSSYKGSGYYSNDQDAGIPNLLGDGVVGASQTTFCNRRKENQCNRNNKNLVIMRMMTKNRANIMCVTDRKLFGRSRGALVEVRGRVAWTYGADASMFLVQLAQPADVDRLCALEEEFVQDHRDFKSSSNQE
eukprot:2354263-Amphidinium_carterae.1